MPLERARVELVGGDPPQYRLLQVSLEVWGEFARQLGLDRGRRLRGSLQAPAKVEVLDVPLEWDDDRFRLAMRAEDDRGRSRALPSEPRQRA